MIEDTTEAHIEIATSQIGLTSNETVIAWLLDYYYSQGYRITCVVGDWIILELR